MAMVYPLYLKWKVRITLDDFQFSLLANTFDLSGVCSDIPGQYLCSNYMEGETFGAGTDYKGPLGTIHISCPLKNLYLVPRVKQAVQLRKGVSHVVLFGLTPFLNCAACFTLY